MSNGSGSLSDGSDAPQVVLPCPDRYNHKIHVGYSEDKEVLSSDREAFARNQPYGPSHYNQYNAGYSDRYNIYNRGVQHAEYQRPTSNRKICGLRPAWFWTAAVLVVLLLIGATAGAVVGGMMRRQSKTPSPESSTSSTSPTPKPELLGSQLSAVNWTDSAGTQRKAVFYQRNGTLHVSHNGGGNGRGSWTEMNIEDQFPAGAVAAMNATPLAASFTSADADADKFFSAALYYFDKDNNIRDLVSTSDDLAAWSKGPLWDVSVAASAMSGLAAAAHICAEGCLGDRIVVFQGSGGDLFSVHGPDWTDAPTRIVAANIGTPLALTPAAYVNSSSDDPPVDWTAERTQLRLYYHRAQSIDEFFFNDETPLVWNAAFAGVATGLDRDAARGLATSPAGPNSVVQVTTLKESGSAVVSFVKGTTGRFEDSTCDLPARFADDGDVITGAPSQGAAAVALSHNFGLYVLTEDGTRILEYSWSNAGPDSFRFQATVV
ncbi:hypothetical protein F5883DRAFT_707082 [Diaporthe sp. PMI_573]|nr:hypothetical protein F5883DRAFT_707082 [Diaporthaceae sp. PMI_573]